METDLYILKDATRIIVDGDTTPPISKVYTIRDLPSEEKPREKLIKHGPSVLKTEELLAVLLNVGTKKEEILHMSNRVVKEYGERSLTSQCDAQALADDCDIPVTKAAQIVACVELGRRFFKRDGDCVSVIRTAKDVFEYVSDMRTLPKEHLRGMYLNAHHKVIYDEVISIGTVNANIIHPREVFKPALLYSAAAVILVHNHPSGEVASSPADIEVTKQLVAAGKLIGIALVDHVIVTKDAFQSIAVSYE